MVDETVVTRPASSRAGKFLRFLKVFGFLLFLAGGFFAGFAAGGGLYVLAGDLAQKVAPLPLVGERAAELLESLEPPLDRFERRELELREMETQILALEKELEAERNRLEEEKKALAEREKLLDLRQAELKQAEEAIEKEKDQSDLFEKMVESFGQVSANQASKILVLLPAPEAAALLGPLGAEQRADILSKMPPEAAARLMRYLRLEWERAGEKSPETLQ